MHLSYLTPISKTLNKQFYYYLLAINNRLPTFYIFSAAIVIYFVWFKICQLYYFTHYTSLNFSALGGRLSQNKFLSLGIIKVWYMDKPLWRQNQQLWYILHDLKYTYMYVMYSPTKHTNELCFLLITVKGGLK